jgi:TonB family protein
MDKNMIKNVSLIVFLFLIAGCLSNKSISAEKLEPKVQAEPKIYDCRNNDEKRIKIFHSMYLTRESAIAAYTKIMSHKKEDRLSQLMAAANRDTIDEATRNSGGNLGYVKFGTLDDDFERDTFNMLPQTVSRPIQSPYGWHIVWIDDVRCSGSRPRKKFVGARIKEYPFAAYVYSWKQIIERLANSNWPEELGPGSHNGKVQLTVAIWSSGKLESIQINTSSGNKRIDEAAVRLVELAAPYPRFTADMLQDTDVLSITRTWTFNSEPVGKIESDISRLLLKIDSDSVFK